VFFDITARAFQRPFCLALLTPFQPSPKLTRDFQSTAIQLFQPILACNRKYFSYQLEHFLLHAERANLLNSNRTIAIAKQAGVWYENFNEKCRQIAMLNPCAECDCGSNAEEFSLCIPLIEQHTAAHLLPLLDLAPHASLTFPSSVKAAYEKIVSNSAVEGVQFSGNSPVMRSLFGANANLKESEDATNSVFPNENSLKSLSSGLIQCIFPLLAGDRIAILASRQRECTGKDLLDKLNLLRISKRMESVQWSNSDANSTFYSSAKQLGGFSVARDRSASWNASPEFPVLIDLNTQRVRSRIYAGKLLAILTGSSTRYFPSDKSLVKHLISLITDIHQLVQLSTYVSWRTVVRKCNLSSADQLILSNCLIELDLTKYSGLRIRKESSELERQLPYRVARL